MKNDRSYDAQAYRDFERATWATLPEHYQEHFGALTAQAADPLLDAVAAGRGTRLLEVACGTGYLAAAAAGRGATAVGLDFVPEMVAEAQRRYPGVDFREGDAEALPFADAKFDAVVCSFGLHHFGRPENALAEAYRVLVPGGRYAFTVWFPPDAGKVNLRQIFRLAIREHGDLHGLLPSAPPEFGSLEECERALLAVGFADATAVEVPILGRWTRRDQVLETLYKGMGRTKALLEAQRAEARAKIEDAILGRVREFDRGGVIEIPNPAMLAHAVKPES